MAQFSNGLLGSLACSLQGAIWVSLRPLKFSQHPGPSIHPSNATISCPPPSVPDSHGRLALVQAPPFPVSLVSLACCRCWAAYQITKGRSQAPPDGTHLYSDELFPHIRSNPAPMSYSVVNKHTDKHKHGRVQTDAHTRRGKHSRREHTQGRPDKTHTHTRTAWLGGITLSIGQQ